MLVLTLLIRLCLTGGWGKIDNIKDITGSVAIEFEHKTYVTALDNGLFTLGMPHNDGMFWSTA